MQTLDAVHRKQGWRLRIQETAGSGSCSASRQEDEVQTGAAGMARTGSLFKEKKKLARQPHECWVCSRCKCSRCPSTRLQENGWKSPEQTVPSVYPKCLQKRRMVRVIPTESLWKRHFRAVWDGWFGGNSPNSCRRPRQLLSLWQETNIGCEGARVVSWKQSGRMHGCTDARMHGRTDGRPGNGDRRGLCSLGDILFNFTLYFLFFRSSVRH